MILHFFSEILSFFKTRKNIILSFQKQLRAELRRMESERQTWDDPSDIDKELTSETSEKVIPNKLKNNFEEIQRQKQQVLEQEIRLAKMQAMENELVQLQEAWNEENGFNLSIETY